MRFAPPRARVRRMLAAVAPDRATIRQDMVAGVPGAIASVPDGMATSILAGVNPVYGLYASFAGPIAGGLSASTRLMVIAPTTAAALAAGSALSSFEGDEKAAALFTLTLIAGVVMIVAGILRFGRYTHFVSFSVMIGFLTGVAVNIVCGQLPDLLGAPAVGEIAIQKAYNVITNPDTIDLASALAGLSAVVILVVLGRTRLAAFAAVFALVIPTLMTITMDTIQRVSDVGTIPTGIPLPHLPDLSLVINPNVLIGALSVTLLILVQGVGVAESAPNADGRASNTDQDFMAQGAGNVASAFFRGQPVGGSIGSTALNRAAGARTRWASIFSGIWMLAILIAFAGIVGRFAMPTLAAVLIVAAAGSLRSGAIESILRTSLQSRIAFVTTLIATLLLPVAAAVGIGVAISLLLQLNKEALDLRVVELVPLADGRLAEASPPATLPDRAVTLLDVYGSLYYAGARTLAARLPEIAGVDRPVLILRLRGRSALGSTGLEVLAGYAERLAGAGGALFLSGVEDHFARQIERSRRFEDAEHFRVFPAEDVIGASSMHAYKAGVEWLQRP